MERMASMEPESACSGDFVVPGDYLCSASAYRPGKGAYLRRGNVYATLTGRVEVDTDSKPSISVRSKKPPVEVPKKGSVVLCKVISVSQRQAKVSILSVNERVLLEPLQGVIRREDIRATDKDNVEVFQSFRPQDVVRARVLSLGESQAYTLSTAEKELGVVFGISEHGSKLVPVSWCEMQCVDTGAKEKRKVAKVVDAVPLT